MYKEIHPLSHFSIEPLGNRLTIRLDLIKKLVFVQVEPVSYYALVFDNDCANDIYVSVEEGEAINKALLCMSDTSLSHEISALTGAVRDLWQLLRARLH